MYEHNKKILVEQFRALKHLNQVGAIGLGKETSNLFRHRSTPSSSSPSSQRLDVRAFNHVISVDAKTRIAEVEGMTTFEDFVTETLKFNLMPAVVPELKTITVGGAATGIGIESSSFKYGLMHETLVGMEVLLADGRVVECSREHLPDLFFGFPNSYGTLGYALKLTVKLVPIKPFVRLTHQKFSTAHEYFQQIQKHCQEKDADFIDGTIFSPTEMYLMLGQFVDAAPYVSDYTYMNIYYRSIREKKTDYVTVRDYIWRWDTDWFWCSKTFGVQHAILRRLWGKKRLRSPVYSKWWRRAGESKLLSAVVKLAMGPTEAVVQDVEIPIENSEKFLEFFHQEIGITPIWVCPVQNVDRKVSYDLYPMNPNTLYINFGFWDSVKSAQPDGFFNKKIEQVVEELGGKKSLYSTSYYSPEKFWQLYNKPAYDQLKAKYDPDHTFKDLYEKCVLKK